MEHYLDNYLPSSPLPSYSSSLRDLPAVPTFRSATSHSRQTSSRRTVPGESSPIDSERVHTHVAHLKNTESSSDSHNWATLQVQSKSSKLPVRIMQSQSIQGSVEINLPTKTKNVESITAELHGEISLIGDSRARFLFVEELLWRSVPGSSTLTGRHSLPFQFYLPAYVSIPQYTSQEVELPFSVDVIFSVSYKLVIKMTRGRFKSNSSIEMPLLYLPCSRAKSPSRRRQVAYRETQVPPGPNHDPEGWHSLGQSIQKGYIFGARVVHVAFTCFLANPLSYAKGTVIPFIIATASDDEQALDLVSSRQALSVCLEKRIQMTTESRLKLKGPKSRNVVGIGSFCPPASTRSTGWRTMEGEIHIASHETPSFQTSLFTCSYTVNVQLSATGFTPLLKKHTIDSATTVADDSALPDNSIPLFSQNVAITTYPSSGPRPIFRTEPVYPTAQYEDCEGPFMMVSTFLL